MCVGVEKPNTETKCHLKKELILYSLWKIIATLGFYWDFLSNAYTLIGVENGEEGPSID